MNLPTIWAATPKHLPHYANPVFDRLRWCGQEIRALRPGDPVTVTTLYRYANSDGVVSDAPEHAVRHVKSFTLEQLGQSQTHAQAVGALLLASITEAVADGIASPTQVTE